MPLAARIDMRAHFFQRKYIAAEVTLGERIRTLYSLMPDQILFKNAFSAAFTDNGRVVALTQFVRSQKQFIICKLVSAFPIVAFKTDLVEVLVLKFI